MAWAIKVRRRATLSISAGSARGSSTGMRAIPGRPRFSIRFTIYEITGRIKATGSMCPARCSGDRGRGAFSLARGRISRGGLTRKCAPSPGLAGEGDGALFRATFCQRLNFSAQKAPRPPPIALCGTHFRRPLYVWHANCNNTTWHACCRRRMRGPRNGDLRTWSGAKVSSHKQSAPGAVGLSSGAGAQCRRHDAVCRGIARCMLRPLIVDG